MPGLICSILRLSNRNCHCLLTISYRQHHTSLSPLAMPALSTSCFVSHHPSPSALSALSASSEKAKRLPQRAHKKLFASNCGTGMPLAGFPLTSAAEGSPIHADILLASASPPRASERWTGGASTATARKVARPAENGNPRQT